MSKADKAGEPSMDEILASIRKIIAEEPVGARKADSAAPDSGNSRGLPAAKSASDETRAKADAPARPEAKAAADTQVRDEAGSRQRLGAPSQPAPQGDKPGPAREPLKPFFPDVGRAAGATAEPTPSAAGPQAVDFGSIVPRRPGDSLLEPPAGLPSERRPQSGRLPEWLARSSPSAPPPARGSAPLPPPAEPTRFPARDAMPSGSSLPEFANLRGDGAASIPPPPGVLEATGRSFLPASAKIAAGEPTRSAGGAGDASVSGSASARRPGTSESAAAQAKSSALATPEAGLGRAGGGASPVQSPEIGSRPGAVATNGSGMRDAEATGPLPSKAPAGHGYSNGVSGPLDVMPAATHTSIPAEPAVPRSERTVPIAEPSATVPKPAALGDRAKPARPAAPADLVPTAAPAGGVRTLEDTVVDLLRPMIRQWLDDNMPRMVEKALRVELAQSVKPKGDQPKH